jgi:hypothetical protein
VEISMASSARLRSRTRRPRFITTLSACRTVGGSWPSRFASLPTGSKVTPTVGALAKES